MCDLKQKLFTLGPLLTGTSRGRICCRILHCAKKNLWGALVRQSIGLHFFRFLAFIYNLYNIRIFHIQTISIFCYKIAILFICYYNGNTRLNYVKPGLTLLIRDLLKSQAISCQLDFNNCFSFYADQYLYNLHPHVRTICYTNDTSRNVTGCSNPNLHAQFP